jgi:hypothetical protein
VGLIGDGLAIFHHCHELGQVTRKAMNVKRVIGFGH